MNALEIDKFGGTSMADATALKQSASIVRNGVERDKAILTVVSAMSGITNQLQKIVGQSINGADYRNLIKEITIRHNELVDQVVEIKKAGSLHQRVERYSETAIGYIQAMVTLKSISALHFDWISSLGERLAAPIFAAHLQDSGLDVVYHSAANVIVTDDNFGNANPLFNETKGRVYHTLLEDLKAGRIVVMGGYYGARTDGEISVFSRGGSDLSATTMGHVLTPWFDPISVRLYKADVAGVMSADPRIVAGAHVVPHMLYEEAAALAAIGGSVIHPKAVHQAVRSGYRKRPPFPIYCRSTLNPEAPGTLIDNSELPDDKPVKAISLIRNAVMLDVGGWGMDRPGIMSRITGVLASRGIDIDFINQPHSKLALGLAFQYAGEEIDLENAIRKGLADEIKGNDVDTVRATRVGVIGVIGKGLSDPRILGKVIAGMDGDFPELRKPDAYSLTTGEFEASILVNLPEERLRQLVQSIHDSVFS